MTYPDIARIDAPDKVRGLARFGADNHRPNLAYGMLAVATIGRGRLVRLDTADARAVPGVQLVLTDREVSDVKLPGFIMTGGFAFQNFQPLRDTAIAYRGQPIALVVGDSLEAAIEGASHIHADYVAEPFSVTIDDPGAETVAQTFVPDPSAGDAEQALASAAVTVDAEYTSPPQHQNPMELIATLAEWVDGELVVYEGTQSANALRFGLAQELGLPAEHIRVISPYAGGGFGQKNSLQMQTVLVAIAARQLGRPVKLVVPRSQIYHDASFRPASRQRIRLGADRAHHMVAAIHDADQQTSRHDLFPASYAETSARLHGIPNFASRARLVRTDVQTPGYMRAPHEHVACFAFESAVDELAYALGVDPVALRLANDTTTDPITGKKLSSRYLAQCLRRGAERFGWNRRPLAPGSMVAEDGTQIGWGVAAGAYSAVITAAIARLRVTNDGAITINVGLHEMGQGARTAIAATVADVLEVPAERVTVVIGDTSGVPLHLTAGSWGTATGLPAVRQAAIAMREALKTRDPTRPYIETEGRHAGPGAPDAVFDQLAHGAFVLSGPVFPDFVSFSYIAHFVEVRVEPHTRRVRVPRVVSVADCGRVISPRTARSQVIGGVVWGIGATLREASEVDPRYGGFLNADFAEYAIPVNADIGEIDVDFIDEPDPLLNTMGAKGLGEVAMVGVAGAIANAIYHATGRRLRHLPIRIDDLL